VKSLISFSQERLVTIQEQFLGFRIEDMCVEPLVSNEIYRMFLGAKGGPAGAADRPDRSKMAAFRATCRAGLLRHPGTHQGPNHLCGDVHTANHREMVLPEPEQLGRHKCAVLCYQN
jgi:hypothetical protein